MADRRALEFNGMAFEHTITKYLRHRYPDAVILNNRSLFSKYLGKVTQIDVIMVHANGVFVLEAKGWRRWVKGGYDDEQWTGQSLSSNTILAFNPINQNIVHIRSLRNTIRTSFGVDIEPFENIVCFPDGTVIESQCREVCNLSMLGVLIDSIMLKRKYHINVDKYAELICKVTD